MSVENEEEKGAMGEVRVGSEPCKPTTSFCGKPAHFVRRRKTAARSAVVPVRFTPEERDELQREGAASRLSLSEFIRAAALRRRLPPQAAPEVNRRTYEELARIGNNLNQLARAVHARAVAVIDAALLQQLADAVRRLGLAVLGAGVR